MSTNKEKLPKGLLLNRLGEILHDSDGLLSLVKMNLLFIFSSAIILPPVTVFTLGPSLAALLYCTNQLVVKGYVPDLRITYFQIFKNSIKSAVIPGIAVSILSVFFTAGLLFYLDMTSKNIMYVPFASVSLLALICIWCVSVHLFPVIAEENMPDKPIKHIISAALGLVFQNMLKTLASVIVSFVFITALILFLPASLPLLLTVAFSVPALCAAFAHSIPDIPQQ